MSGVDSAEPSAIVRRLGPYEVLCHLATGGMAELYLGRATGLEGFEKIVALKQIRRELNGNREMVELFLDEARLAATLHHPNVAQVYDVGFDDGRYFFSMEFVHGADLHAVLETARQRGATVPLDVALAIATAVCAGLHHAHEKKDAAGKPLGIIHRDVSPSNILVSFDGAVKVVDFGIAKAATRSSETRKGDVRGKVYYMSPEQCQAKPLDRRSDVFAIGAVLYELTCGRRLFLGDSEFAVMRSIVKGSIPSPTQIRPDYPPRLARILERALRRDPLDRFATAEEMLLELEAFARAERLTLSSMRTARFMESLFEKRLAAWRSAHQLGKGLAAHVVETTTRQRSAPDDPPRTEATITVPAARPARRFPRAWLGAALGGLVAAAAIAWTLHAIGGRRSARPADAVETATLAPTPARAEALKPEGAPPQPSADAVPARASPGKPAHHRERPAHPNAKSNRDDDAFRLP